mmetsp:Transcript_83908/g.201260  ORF Transcript_83908/g.201260 Transcript_83908/m.201260 type:complete len:434 (+) Transcript_83908:55-1356(+)
MASLLQLVGDNDLEGVNRCLAKIHAEHGKAALLNEITTCEHEGRNAKSAIHRAALRGYVSLVERFLQEEVRPNIVDDQGNTPLHLAVDLGRARVVQSLLQARASPEIRNCFGRSPKDMSIANDWDAPEIAEGKQLIRRMLEGEQVPLDGLPAEPSGQITERHTPSIDEMPPVPDLKRHSVVSDRVSDVVELDTEPQALEEPEDFDAMSDYELVQVSLKALVRKEDEKAVRRWISCKHVHELLWPGMPSQMAIISAVGSGEDGEGEDLRVAPSPLHVAALRGNINILKMLLETRVNPNVTNDQGSTPLHFAVDLDRAESAQLLLKWGANPHQKNNFGRTPYQMRDGRGEHVVPNHVERMVTICFRKTMAESDKECTICQEDFRENEVLRVLPCLHKYHAFCIDEWLSRSLTRSCPSCMHCLDESDHEELQVFSL